MTHGNVRRSPATPARHSRRPADWSLPAACVTFHPEHPARHSHVPAGPSRISYSTYPRIEGADDMSIVLGPNQYGKAENRLVRVYRDTARHEIRDLNVSSALRGDFRDAHITGDQSAILPTDTQKNTVFAFAKQKGVHSIEEFGLTLGDHFIHQTPKALSLIHI